MTSTSGVTLIWDFGPPDEPPVSIAMELLQFLSLQVARLPAYAVCLMK